MQIASQWALRGPHHDAVTDASWHPSYPLVAAVGVTTNPDAPHHRDAFFATFQTYPLQLRNITLLPRGAAHLWGPESERLTLARDPDGWLIGGTADVSLCPLFPNTPCNTSTPGAFVLHVNDAGAVDEILQPPDAHIVTSLLAEGVQWWVGGLSIDVNLHQLPPRSHRKVPRYWVQAYHGRTPTWRQTWEFTPTMAYRTPPLAKLQEYQGNVVAWGTSSGTGIACNVTPPYGQHAVYARAMDADTGALSWCQVYPPRRGEHYEFVDAAAQGHHLLALGNLHSGVYFKSFPRLLWLRPDGAVERTMDLHTQHLSLAQSMSVYGGAIWITSFGISSPPAASTVRYAPDAIHTTYTTASAPPSPISFAQDAERENVWVTRLHTNDPVSFMWRSPRGGREGLALRPNPSNPRRILAFGYTDSDAIRPWMDSDTLHAAAQWTDGYLLEVDHL